MSRALTVSIVLIVGLALIVASCGRVMRLERERISAEGYAISRGTAAQLGADDRAEFGGRLSLLWSEGLSGKPAGPLAIHNDLIIFPESKKKIRFFEVASGDQPGRWRANGVPQTGVAVADSLAIYGVSPRKDFLRAVDFLTGKRLWQRNVKDVRPGPIIVGNRLIVSSADGRVLALELGDGETAWETRPEWRPSAAASYGHGRIFQPCDRGRLYALSADSGRELYEVRVDGPLVSPVAVGDLIYAAVMTGQVYGVDPDDGRVVWQSEIGGPTWTSPAVCNGRLFVGHSGGELVALDAADGQILWRHATGHVIRASALAVGDKVVFGTMTGQLFVLKAEDGAVVDSTTLSGAIEVPPVTDGRRLFVATQAGKIYCFGDVHEQAVAADQRIDVGLQSQ
ncbi:MAG: PQQ-binding-like beta-propeller repeat protein [Candidatus Zixiibacteriota bacterium]